MLSFRCREKKRGRGLISLPGKGEREHVGEPGMLQYPVKKGGEEACRLVKKGAR